MIYNEGNKELVPIEVFYGEHRGELSGKPYTYQEMFDLAWQHSQIDNQPQSYDSEQAVCKYRLNKKTACFIGIMVPDVIINEVRPDKRDDSMLASDFAKELRSKDFSLFETDDEYLNFIDDLQDVHDNVALSGGGSFIDESGNYVLKGYSYKTSVGNMLIDFAKKYNLNYPEEIN